MLTTCFSDEPLRVRMSDPEVDGAKRGKQLVAIKYIIHMFKRSRLETHFLVKLVEKIESDGFWEICFGMNANLTETKTTVLC